MVYLLLAFVLGAAVCYAGIYLGRRITQRIAPPGAKTRKSPVPKCFVIDPNEISEDKPPRKRAGGSRSSEPAAEPGQFQVNV